MRFIRLLLLTLIVTQATACKWPRDQWETCEPIGKASRVEIMIYSEKSTDAAQYSFADAKQIARLLTFANARRQSFRPSFYTMPYPKTVANFYDGHTWIGTIGSGPNFFFVSSLHCKGIRSAHPDELAEFDRLISRQPE